MDGDNIVPPEWEMNARMGQMMGPEAGMEGAGPAPGGGGGPKPGQKISEKPVSNVPPHEQPIGGPPPIVPLQRMADM